MIIKKGALSCNTEDIFMVVANQLLPDTLPIFLNWLKKIRKYKIGL